MRFASTVLLTVCFGAGCGGSQTYVLQTDGFIARYPRGWTVTPEVDGPIRGYRFRLEGQPDEVRVFSWFERGKVADATTEVARRLRDGTIPGLPDDQSRLGAAPGCGEEPAAVPFMGRSASVVGVRNQAGVTVIVGAQDEGSLIAVIARSSVAPSRSCALMSPAVERFIASITGVTTLPIPSFESWISHSDRTVIPPAAPPPRLRPVSDD